MPAYRPVLVAAFAATFFCSPAIAADCDDLLPPAGASASDHRAITPTDLVRMRDIGPAGNGDPGAEILTLSPDKKYIAFQLRRADPVTNSYCLGMFVMPVRPGAKPLRVDTGGDFIRLSFSVLGYAASTPPGIPIVVTPRWSPDGKWIAYLRRDGGTTQVWRAATDGSGARSISNVDFDIEDFSWTADGSGLIVTGRPGLRDAELALSREGAQGFLYDERFMPASSNRPYVREPVPVKRFELSLGGQLREISSDGGAEPGPSAPLPAGAILLAKGLGSKIAWLQKTDHPDAHSEYEFHVRSEAGRDTVCQSAACDGAQNVWWVGKNEVVFQASPTGAGWLSFYRWRVGEKPPTLILRSEDVFLGCQEAEQSLICAQEGFTQPRRVVRMDLGTGHIEAIFDPNPEFQQMAFGQVQRLHWENNLGIPTYGDLVLPPSHQVGQKHPLVIVQYGSRGFLRGGTGDDYPIHVLAAHGFAVLSMSRPLDYGTFMKGKTLDDEDRLGQKDWADRKSVQSAMEEGIRTAAALGVIDVGRMGITGLSDGASTVQFSMIDSHLFKAAAMSNCCVEQLRISALLGPLISDRYMRRLGYPKLTQDGSNFWAAMSLRQNAARIETPLLLQLPDDEYMGALESYEALREQGKPVELVVFPDENHVKWQPAHRLASYTRSVDRFDFWLKNVIDPSPEKAAEYRRWNAMRSALPEASSGTNER